MTPHKKPLENPIPLMFLKVRPEVIFKFHFLLQDSKVIPELTAEKKLQLFKEILMEFGIGAKTNVGYGQFTSELAIKEVSNRTDEDILEPQRPVRPRRAYEEKIHLNSREVLKSGNSFPGEIVDFEEDYAIITFKANDGECVIRKNHKSIKKMDKSKMTSLEELVADDQVKITVNRDYLYGEILNCSVKLTNK